MTEIIITMAGFGRRFLDAGYKEPKYRIQAHGRSLFFWSIVSLRNFIEAGARFTFVVRGADNASGFIQDEARLLGIRSANVIELDAPTAGQAVTAHLAGDALHDKAAPMMIYNIDTFVHPDSIQPRDIRGDGWIPCFNAPGEAWSFAAADETGRVHDIREKNRISNHATIGLYWFSSFDLYSAHYQKYYSNDANIEAGERYVAPIYNGLIADGHPVYITDVPFKSVIPLGVPDDLNRFLARMPPEV